jgi:hypothetical protein
LVEVLILSLKLSYALLISGRYLLEDQYVDGKIMKEIFEKQFPKTRNGLIWLWTGSDLEFLV